MKYRTYEDIKRAFDSGQNIFRRSSVFPLLVKIELLQDKLEKANVEIAKLRLLYNQPTDGNPPAFYSKSLPEEWQKK